MSLDLAQLGGRIVWTQVFHNLIAEREIDAAVLCVDRNASGRAKRKFFGASAARFRASVTSIAKTLLHFLAR
jgi:hypothetical protein